MKKVVDGGRFCPKDSFGEIIPYQVRDRIQNDKVRAGQALILLLKKEGLIFSKSLHKRFCQYRKIFDLFTRESLSNKRGIRESYSSA